MKKTTKVISIIAAVSCIAGIICTVAGVIGGATFGNLSWNRYININPGYNFGRYHPGFDYSTLSIPGNTEIDSIDFYFAGKKNVSIVSGDSFSVQNGKNTPISQDGSSAVSENGLWSYMNGTTWVVEAFKFSNSNVVITIPQNAEFYSVNINSDASAVRINTPIAADDFNLDSDAGAVSINAALISQNVEISSDAGAIDISGDFNSAYAVIENDAGKISVSNSIGDTEWHVSTDMGTVDIVSNKNADNYNYSVDTDLGSVTINGVKVSGSHHAASVANTLYVECDMGTVNFHFNGEVNNTFVTTNLSKEDFNNEKII